MRTTRQQRRATAVERNQAHASIELLEDRSLLTPTIAFPRPESQIYTRPGGNDFTWTYTTGTTAEVGFPGTYPVSEISYQNITAFNWSLTRGTIQYASSTSGPWTDLTVDSSGPHFVSVTNNVFRFVDSMGSDTTTTDTVGVSWRLGGGPTGNTSTGTQVVPDNAPTDITSDRSVVLDDSTQSDVVATLSPTDTGSALYGRWVIDSQSVSNLFTISSDNTTNNKATSLRGTGTMPAVGQTVSVTVHYYDLFQTDSNNDPINGEGFSKTLNFTVVANDTNSLTTFENNVTANTFTSGIQQNPALATLSNGNYVAVWQSAGQDKTSSSYSGIYGQIFDSTGTPVGSEFVISNASTTSDEITPVVTALNDGRFAVAYSVKASGNYEIGVRIVEANGTVGSQVIANATATGEDQVTPSIATLTDGSFVVSWANATTSDIKLQQFSAANASAIASNVTVAAADGYLQSVAALSNGSYIVAWDSYADGKVNFRLGTSSSVSTTIDQSNNVPPRIAPLSNGFVIVSDVYNSGTNKYGLVAGRYSNAGALQGSTFDVNTQSGNQYAPSIATLSDGGFAVAWTSETVDQIYNGIAGRRFDASGTAVDTNEFQINQFRAKDQSFPAITALANHGFATAWNQQADNSSYPLAEVDVVTRAFNAVTTTPAATLSVSASSGTESGSTAITVTATADGAVSGDQTLDLTVTGTNITAGDFSLTDGDTGTAGIQIKIANGQTTGTVTFTIGNDKLLEGTETATLTISNPTSGLTLGKTTSQTVDISDDEAATLDIEATSTVTEAGGSQSAGKVTLSISGSGSGSFTLGTGISITADVTDAGTGTATSGTDYTAIGTQTVKFNNGAASGDSKQISIAVTDDSDIEGDETIALSLGNLAGSSVTKSLGTKSNTTTITDNDFAGPTLSSIALSDSALRIGDTSTVTFTFSEPVTGFDTGDITAPNGSLSSVVSSDGGTTWSGTYTPNANIEDSSNTIDVNLSGVQNGKSIAGSGTFSSNNFVIDTKRPTVTITLSDTALKIGDTAKVTLTFSEAVSGLTTGDLFVANGSVSSISSADGGITWSATLTPASNVEDATNVITLDNTGVTDLAGNSGSGETDSENYAIDTKRPTVTIDLSAMALSIGETSGVTFTFSEAVTGFTTADLLVDNGAVTGLSSSDGGFIWTATLTPDVDVENSTNVITLDNSGVSDLAGNSGSGTTDSAVYSIDTHAPTAIVAVADLLLSLGETSNVTITFSEAVTRFTTADLQVDNGLVTGLSSSDGGVTWSATLTPAAFTESVTNHVTLDTTGVSDLAGNDGSTTAISNNFAIDTVQPTADIIDITPDPRSRNAGFVTVSFNEDVTGVDIADFTLTRDMKSIDISKLSVSGSGKAYTLDLSTVTTENGSYQLTLVAAGSNIIDAANNALAADASDSWERVNPTVDLSVLPLAINEGKSAVVTATLSSATDVDVTVNVTLG